MIVKIDEQPIDVDITTLAEQFIDKEIYIGWPHLREAKVFAVSDLKVRIEKTGVERFPNGNNEFLLLSKHVNAQ